jgi:hypothetical protein
MALLSHVFQTIESANYDSALYDLSNSVKQSN